MTQSGYSHSFPIPAYWFVWLEPPCSWRRGTLWTGCRSIWRLTITLILQSSQLIQSVCFWTWKPEKHPHRHSENMPTERPRPASAFKPAAFWLKAISLCTTDLLWSCWQNPARLWLWFFGPGLSTDLDEFVLVCASSWSGWTHGQIHSLLPSDPPHHLVFVYVCECGCWGDGRAG